MFNKLFHKDELSDWEKYKLDKEREQNGEDEDAYNRRANRVITIITAVAAVFVIGIVGWVICQFNAEKIANSQYGWIAIGLGIVDEPAKVEEPVAKVEDVTMEEISKSLEKEESEPLFDEVESLKPTPVPPTPTPPTPNPQPYHDDPHDDPMYQGHAAVGGGRNLMSVEEAEKNLALAEAMVIRARIDLFEAEHPDMEKGDPEWEQYGELVKEYGEKTSEVLGVDFNTPSADPGPKSPDPEPPTPPSPDPDPSPKNPDPHP